jgi:hypothetical protein
MHSISICFGPTGTIWNLLYKSEETMKAAWEKLENRETPRLVIGDDFGQNLAIVRDQLHAFLIEDLDVSQLAQIERGLHQARSQAKAQTRAMEDPTIKESLRRQQMGPAVMAPVPGGRFNG